MSKQQFTQIVSHWAQFFYSLITQYLRFSAILIFIALSSPLLANNISNTNKYAWSENAGWLNFKSTHEQVTVYNDHLEGYVWSAKVGWIRLGTHITGGEHTYTNDAADTYGVNIDSSGNLSGYAWSENIGWIDFNPSHNQVTIDTTTGDFDGYAWSAKVGWIHFQNTVPAYKVSVTPSFDFLPAVLFLLF